MVITHIATGLPPQIDGVGDYACQLAAAMRMHGVESRFVVPPAEAAPTAGAFPVTVLMQRAASDLADALEAGSPQTVLLHFSGYGYAESGMCWWLVDGLRRWKSGAEGRRLITVFHELYATGLPWQRSFWTALPQRRIARGLAAISDAAVTTSARAAATLARWCPNLRLVLNPVFSNVGECSAPPPLQSRGPFGVIFGKEASRRRAYAALRKGDYGIAKGLRRLGVERVWDIGPLVPTPAAVAGLPVEPLGPLASAAVSARLAQARVGLADYPLHVLTKSGIMAAYFAHGLLAVNTSTVGRLPGDLKEGRHFVGPARLADPRVDGQAVATEGHGWYCGHGRDATAKAILSLLQ
jgi:hypothetical protein